MREYNGVIFYNGRELGTSVKVKKYIFMENALILHYETITDIIPYHAFTNASFDKINEEKQYD